MTQPTDRRDFLKIAAALGGGAAIATLPPSIRRALALPARQETGTIKDVRHVVILMQENRSFDHYFGALRGVRGFGDPRTIPLEGGRRVWAQSDGSRELPPFHLDTATTNALRVPGTPHSFADAQAAWGQGRLCDWPKYKTPFSMGYYRREDIPFQYALAEAFTICDAYHCSVTSGTDPNRIVFWSGSSFDPERRAAGLNATDADSEPNNLRCWVKGALPEPGYQYQGSAFHWPTIPDVLEKAGVSWRIYQDPNDNWTGAMHGCLAFESFRTAKPGGGIYRNGMSHWSLEQLAEHVAAGTLPAVSWVLPPKAWSEHPSASTPVEGAEFTARVLDILTSNPEVWGRTVFFQTFDENDGLFDHAPPPAPPSYEADGSLAGKSTLELAGSYFHDPDHRFRDRRDVASGPVRPWGLGPRVPMYVVSPWSKGGWVNSQVFDHTSVGQFLEKRFDVVVPAISPWHRAVCGDLTSAFDFATPNDPSFPRLPEVKGSTQVVAQHVQRPSITPPAAPQPLFQEPGTRPSRRLPYRLETQARRAGEHLVLTFENRGQAGAVFHVYDRRHLDRIPRRYTVEAGKSLSDTWPVAPSYDLEVFGPNGFYRAFAGGSTVDDLELLLDHDARGRLALTLANRSPALQSLQVRDAYSGAVTELRLKANGRHAKTFDLTRTGGWYDLSVVADGGLVRRAAGRIEMASHSISDPAIAAGWR